MEGFLCASARLAKEVPDSWCDRMLGGSMSCFQKEEYLNQ